jgi:hypothetical protein
MRPGLLFALAGLLAACSANGTKSGFDGSGGAGAGTATGTGGAGTGGVLGTGGGVTLADGGAKPPAKAHLIGKVTAPEGTIPIAGALVYLTQKTPDPIPGHAFCDHCVELTSATPYVLTQPDGSFDLPTPYLGASSLVVQKGQFRRIRPVDVKAGDNAVPGDATRFPSKTDDAAGDHIPKMAVVQGAWDAVEVTLAKLGLGTLKKGFLGRPEIDTASFDVLAGQAAQSVLGNAGALGQYNIVFLPCTGDSNSEPLCNDFWQAADAGVKKNLEDFVGSGGKLYVTDWSYEYVRQPFPGYLSWVGETPDIGSACTLNEWNGAATMKDPGLEAWMQAQGLLPFDAEKNYLQIEGVHPVQGQDANGDPATITPKVWVEASGRPATVSFEQKCGRVMYSTYHTEADQGSFTNLLPQEKALMYILLEVGVCVGQGVPR